METSTRYHAGFTLIEVLTCIAIILILAAFLLSSVHAAREKGKQAVCINNLKQLTASIIMIAVDQDKFPAEIAYQTAPADAGYGPSSAYAAMSDYYGHQMEITHCPKVSGEMLDSPAVYSYGINGLIRGRSYHVFSDPSQVVVVGETANKAVLKKETDIGYRHMGQAFAGFVDGHVEKLLFSQIQTGISSLFPFDCNSICHPGGFRWDFPGTVTENMDGTFTMNFDITNYTKYGVSYVAFELPPGVTAVWPQDGAVYAGPRSSYTVLNTTNNPFRSIKFQRIGSDEVKNGASDTLSFKIDQSQRDLIQDMKVQAHVGYDERMSGEFKRDGSQSCNCS